MLMRMLEAGGIAPVTDGIRAADDDNPRGYYEIEAAKLLPQDTAWLKAAPGKAVKVVSALLERLPSSYQYRIVFLERDLGEVLASQRRMLERRGEPTDRIPEDSMATLFRKHVASVLARAGERAEMQLMVLAHADALASPEQAAARLDSFLGGGLDQSAMAAAVDRSLWRQRSSALASNR